MRKAKAVLQAITRELPIFLRENANGIYRVDAYFLAKTSAEVSSSKRYF